MSKVTVFAIQGRIFASRTSYACGITTAAEKGQIVVDMKLKDRLELKDRLKLKDRSIAH